MGLAFHDLMLESSLLTSSREESEDENTLKNDVCALFLRSENVKTAPIERFLLSSKLKTQLLTCFRERFVPHLLVSRLDSNIKSNKRVGLEKKERD